MESFIAAIFGALAGFIKGASDSFGPTGSAVALGLVFYAFLQLLKRLKSLKILDPLIKRFAKEKPAAGFEEDTTCHRFCPRVGDIFDIVARVRATDEEICFIRNTVVRDQLTNVERIMRSIKTQLLLKVREAFLSTVTTNTDRLTATEEFKYFTCLCEEITAICMTEVRQRLKENHFASYGKGKDWVSYKQEAIENLLNTISTKLDDLYPGSFNFPLEKVKELLRSERATYHSKLDDTFEFARQLSERADAGEEALVKSLTDYIRKVLEGKRYNVVI